MQGACIGPWNELDTQWYYPEGNNNIEEDMKWCSQGIVVLRDLGAQANSGCSWISALATDSVRRSAEPCKVRVSATWNELDTQWY